MLNSKTGMKSIKNFQVYHSYSAADTFSIGEKIGKSCRLGDVFLLNGDLGTGKTVFSKGFAKGLGIVESVSSPTFTVLQIYEEGRLPLYHFDVYRIADVEEMDEIGYEDYFYGQGVCLVEWADFIEEILPDHAVTITIEKEYEKGFNYRRITISDTNIRMQK